VLLPTNACARQPVWLPAVHTCCATDDVHARDRRDAAAAAAAAATAASVPAGKRRRRKDKAREQKANASSNKPRKDAEFGVTRGIDFKGVRSIVNFDPPDSVQGYVHRVGRTGRAGQSGLALSLFTPQDGLLRSALEEALGAQLGDVCRPVSNTASSDSDSDSDDEPGSSDAGGKQQQQQVETKVSLLLSCMRWIAREQGGLLACHGRNLPAFHVSLHSALGGCHRYCVPLLG
jgi:superfamily II DNA/RNA helicase